MKNVCNLAYFKRVLITDTMHFKGVYLSIKFSDTLLHVNCYYSLKLILHAIKAELESVFDQLKYIFICNFIITSIVLNMEKVCWMYW